MNDVCVYVLLPLSITFKSKFDKFEKVYTIELK